MGTDIQGKIRVEDFKIDSESVSFKIGGILYSFNLSEISKRLAEASDAERDDYKISPSGYGIHWSLLDEDLSIPALVSKRGTQ